MKVNPDNRKDNVDRIQENIDNTAKNISLTNEMIDKKHNEKEKKDLKAKNCRREESIGQFKAEIKDEACDKKRGYK